MSNSAIVTSSGAPTASLSLRAISFELDRLQESFLRRDSNLEGRGGTSSAHHPAASDLFGTSALNLSASGSTPASLAPRGYNVGDGIINNRVVRDTELDIIAGGPTRAFDASASVVSLGSPPPPVWQRGVSASQSGRYANDAPAGTSPVISAGGGRQPETAALSPNASRIIAKLDALERTLLAIRETSQRRAPLFSPTAPASPPKSTSLLTQPTSPLAQDAESLQSPLRAMVDKLTVAYAAEQQRTEQAMNAAADAQQAVAVLEKKLEDAIAFVTRGQTPSPASSPATQSSQQASGRSPAAPSSKPESPRSELTSAVTTPRVELSSTSQPAPAPPPGKPVVAPPVRSDAVALQALSHASDAPSTSTQIANAPTYQVAAAPSGPPVGPRPVAAAPKRSTAVSPIDSPTSVAQVVGETPAAPSPAMPADLAAFDPSIMVAMVRKSPKSRVSTTLSQTRLDQVLPTTQEAPMSQTAQISDRAASPAQPEGSQRTVPMVPLAAAKRDAPAAILLPVLATAGQELSPRGKPVAPPPKQPDSVSTSNQVDSIVQTVPQDAGFGTASAVTPVTLAPKAAPVTGNTAVSTTAQLPLIPKPRTPKPDALAQSQPSNKAAVASPDISSVRTPPTGKAARLPASEASGKAPASEMQPAVSPEAITQLRQTPSKSFSASRSSSRDGSITAGAGSEKVAAEYGALAAVPSDDEILRVVHSMLDGIILQKHCRRGWPHKRIFWLDVSSNDLTFSWGKAELGINNAKGEGILIDAVKNITVGQATDVLKRSGNKKAANRYISLHTAQRTLDFECDTPEMAADLHRVLDYLRVHPQVLQEALMYIVDQGIWIPPHMQVVGGEAEPSD